MLLTTALTSGQITFILRIIIQALSYGGVFLIGLIILGNSPRSAHKETHDVLNRVVGQSTATSRTMKWTIKRIFNKSGDPRPSKSLLFAFALFLVYGLLASLSDIGFLGLNECTVPYPSFDTPPASIHTEADARTLVGKNLINGTDPKLIRVHQCDFASDVVVNVNVTERICSQWHNTTYDDPTLFRSLNLSDSDVLMYQNLGKINNSRGFYLNNYFVGTSDRVVLEPTIRNGMAVLPHKTGVRMVVGAPAISKNQFVTIPKAMGVEIDVGCLSVGVFGAHDAAASGSGYDYFMLDSFYKPTQRSRFSGPEYLFEPLQRAADAVRKLIQPAFNTSIVDGKFIRSNNQSSFTFTWQTQINNWYPSNGTFGALSDASNFVLTNCSAQVHTAVNASIPSDPVKGIPQACGFYQVAGSWAEDGGMHLAYIPMVCASATAVNLVSATLEMDNDGRIDGQFSHLPSDLNIVRANYFDVIQNRDNETVWVNFDQIQRFTLSDNPGGNLQHYIYQQTSFSWMGSLSEGAGSPGYAISQVGGAIISAGTSKNNPTVLAVDSAFFSFVTDFEKMVSTVSQWAAGYGASYLLATFSMNGFAALDKPRFTIQSSGGRPAVCYRTPYVAGFIPLILAAVVVMLWSLHMFVSSRLRDVKKWEGLYGGVVPTTVFDKHSPNTILVWDETESQPRLRSLADDGENEKATMLSSPTTSSIYPQHHE